MKPLRKICEVQGSFFFPLRANFLTCRKRSILILSSLFFSGCLFPRETDNEFKKIDEKYKKAQQEIDEEYKRIREKYKIIDEESKKELQEREEEYEKRKQERKEEDKRRDEKYKKELQEIEEEYEKRKQENKGKSKKAQQKIEEKYKKALQQIKEEGEKKRQERRRQEQEVERQEQERRRQREERFRQELAQALERDRQERARSFQALEIELQERARRREREFLEREERRIRGIWGASSQRLEEELGDFYSAGSNAVRQSEAVRTVTEFSNIIQQRLPRNPEYDPRSAGPCQVCQDVESSEDYYQLSCSHSFHLSCIAGWFYTRESAWYRLSCPVCRGEGENDSLTP